MTAPSTAEPDDEGGTAAVVSGPLFIGIGFTSLDHALERFRDFCHAHPDMEPSLRCERDRSGRRRWVLDVYLRPNPRREP
jgi:hypothetical protein